MAAPKLAYKDYPSLRRDSFKEDGDDARRVAFVKDRWHSQDAALRLRDRQIEENVRMLCGQQWTVWSDMLGRFVDVSRLMSDRDRRWRQRPVVNKLLEWFILTHARLTENPPSISFLPSSGDRHDAMLAEVMDTVFKAKSWEEPGMLEVIDRMVAWMIPGGTAYIKSRIDPRKGELVTYRGPGMVPVLGPDGVQVQMEPLYVEDAAYDRDGNLITQGFLDEEGVGYHEPGGKKAHAERKGALARDVLSAIEVRGQWGEHIPWHHKRWHIHRTFITPEDAYELLGVDCEPDITVGGEGGPGELQQLMMGSGFFGAANSEDRSALSSGEGVQQFVAVYEMWEAPAEFPGMEETEDSAGGRLLIVAGDKVARDSVRPGRFKYTSPLRRFDFINLPGRPSGSTPQEAMNPIQRAYNRNTALIQQHTALSADPKPMIRADSNIEPGAFTNEPGVGFIHTSPVGSSPVEYVVPPRLDESVFRNIELLDRTLTRMGSAEGAQGTPPQRDASGELVKELRFNADRPIASTSRRIVLELARMAEDDMVLLPQIMDEDEIISYAGEDSVVRTVTVSPEMFTLGKVNVRADIESMLPEGRGERQARVHMMYNTGIFGPPGSPEAVSTYLEFARFPHMGRDSRPGGIHRVTAEQENGKLVRGAPAAEIQVLEVYDHAVHLAVHEQLMASPEFLKFAPEVQQAFFEHRQAHKMAVLELQAQAMEEQAMQMVVADEAAAEGAGMTRPIAAEMEPPAPKPGTNPGMRPGQPAPEQP